MSQRGIFLSVEGGEGVGKSTNIHYLESWLKERGIAYRLTREPGGTPLAEAVRQLLLEHREEAMSVTTELLLIFAARAQHIEQVIEPALARGDWVICDRFTDATYAYQGGGRKMSSAEIAQLETLVQADLRPDITLLLDAPVEVGMARAGQRSELDRFEQEELAFFQRVRNCYLARAAAEPDRFRVIDCDRPLAKIEEDLITIMTKLAEDCGR